MIAIALLGLLLWAPWQREDIEHEGLPRLTIRLVGMVACITITVSEAMDFIR